MSTGKSSKSRGKGKGKGSGKGHRHGHGKGKGQARKGRRVHYEEETPADYWVYDAKTPTRTLPKPDTTRGRRQAPGVKPSPRARKTAESCRMLFREIR